MLVVNITLQPNIWPQSNPLPSTKADFDVFIAGSASAVRASEKCLVITYRKLTTRTSFPAS